MMIETWISRAAVLTGAITLVVPILGYRRADRRQRGRASGAAGVLRWSFMVAMTALYIVVGIALWKPIPLDLPVWAQVTITAAGALLYFPGVALYLWAYRTLGNMFGLSSGFGAALYADHRLVQTGPFGIVRHPMYLGVILAGFGALLIFRTWATALFASTICGVVFRARREEALLAAEFGQEWEAYKKRVPGWIPRFRAGKGE